MTSARWVLHGVLAREAMPPGARFRGGETSKMLCRARHLRVADLVGIATRLTTGLKTLNALEEAALAHHHLLTEISLEHDVLPLRFGKAFGSLGAAARLMALHAPAWRTALAKIAGRQEITCRVSLSPVHEATAPGHGGAEARGYLAKRLHDRRRATNDAARLERAARSLADLVREGGSDSVCLRSAGAQRGGVLALDALVRRSGTGATLTALKTETGRLEKEGIKLELGGPWAPYSFVAAEEARHA